MFKPLTLYLAIAVLSTACGNARKDMASFPVTADCLSTSQQADLQLLAKYFGDYLSLAYADGATPTAIHYQQFGQETSEDLSLAHLCTAEATKQN